MERRTYIPRRFSIGKERNVDSRQFYDDELPLPVSNPIKDIHSKPECELEADDDVDVIINHLEGTSLGSIVFNGCLLKTHSMAGCFMTITPTDDGFIDVPENVKVIFLNNCFPTVCKFGYVV